MSDPGSMANLVLPVALNVNSEATYMIVMGSVAGQVADVVRFTENGNNPLRRQSPVAGFAARLFILPWTTMVLMHVQVAQTSTRHSQDGVFLTRLQASSWQTVEAERGDLLDFPMFPMYPYSLVTHAFADDFRLFYHSAHGTHTLCCTPSSDDRARYALIDRLPIRPWASAITRLSPVAMIDLGED